MTVVVLRPNGTNLNTGSVVGAGSAHAALNDNSDSSYVVLDPGEIVTCDTDDLTLPAGAVVKNVQLRGRLAYATALCIVEGRVDVTTLSGQYHWESQVVTPSPPPGTYSFTASSGYAGNFTEAEIDSALVTFYSLSGGMFPDTAHVYEAYLNVRYVTKPSTFVAYPTGTITDTNTPDVIWSEAGDADGGSITRWEMKVFSAAQYGAGGFDPDTSTATYASGDLPPIADGDPNTGFLPDGTYRAYVRVAQTVNGAYHWGDWDFEAFTILVELPAIPTIALTAQDENACIRIELTGNAGDATTTGFELEASVNAGTTWLPVRNTLGLGERLVGDDVVVLDYEAPNGRITNYRARAVHDYGDGLFGVSDWEIDDAMWSSSHWWLKHPNLPPLNLPVTVRSYRSVQRTARQGVITALGAVLPLVVSEVRSGARGVVVLHTLDLEGLQTLERLLDENATFLLHGPYAEGEPDRYVRFGDEDASRLVDNGAFHRRDVTLPWIEVVVPDGAMTGEYGDEIGVLL